VNRKRTESENVSMQLEKATILIKYLTQLTDSEFEVI